MAGVQRAHGRHQPQALARGPDPGASARSSAGVASGVSRAPAQPYEWASSGKVPAATSSA